MASADSMGYNIRDDTSDDGHAVDVDTSTVATRALMTPDGKCVHHPWVEMRGKDPASGQVYQRESCPECTTQYEANKEALRQRKLELNRQLEALENENHNNNNETTTGSVSDDRKESHAYRPPLPLQQQQQQQALMDETPSAYSYLQRQQQQSPRLPLTRPPNRTFSANSVGSSGSTPQIITTGMDSMGNGGIALNSPSTLPFSNPYDPHYLAAAANAFHQQQLQIQQKSAPYVSQDESHQGTILYKLLQDKDNELKQVRRSLQELQEKYQEQSLLAMRLQTTLDQAREAFEKERQLIRLQAEQDARESLTARQDAIFEKQLKWMETSFSNMNTNNNASSANADTTPKPPPAAATATTKSEPPNEIEQKETVGNDSSSSLPAKKKHPWNTTPGKQKPNPTSLDGEKNNNNNNEEELRKADQPSSSSKTKNLFKIPSTASNNKKLYPSIDDALMGSNGKAAVENNNSNGNGIKVQKQPTEPKTPVGLRTAETPMVSNTSTTKKGSSSDRFDPVYKEGGSTTATTYFSPSSGDDEKSLGQTVASSTYGDDRVKVVNKKLLDPYGDKGTYTGVVLRNTGMPHGLGRMVYEEDRRVFEGDWRHGRWHGYGRATFSNGDSYEGEYKFDQRHGTGVYRWNDGRVYDGHFSEDKRHGKGVFTWPDGAVYDGDFVNGQRQGNGKYTFADGGQYEGAWKDGRYDGFGTCTWEDGRRYRGEWRNGMAHGRGTETYPNGNIRHEGEWIDDEPVR